MSQINPFHNLPFYFFKTHFNTPSTLRSSKLSVSLRFQDRKRKYPFILPECAMWSAPLMIVYFITQIIIFMQYKLTKFINMKFFHPTATSFIWGPNVVLNTLFLKNPSIYFAFDITDQVSQAHTSKTGKLLVIKIKDCIPNAIKHVFKLFCL